MLSDVTANPAVEPMMTERKPRKPAPMKGRKDIGEVEFPIEKLMKFRDASASKLMKFRDASASCVHIEAKMVADRGLTDTGKKHPK
jgi:hypothetical protein